MTDIQLILTDKGIQHTMKFKSDQKIRDVLTNILKQINAKYINLDTSVYNFLCGFDLLNDPDNLDHELNQHVPNLGSVELVRMHEINYA